MTRTDPPNPDHPWKDMSRSEPMCDDSIDCESNCCTPGGSLIAIFYFVSFMVFAKLVLLNIVVAILMTQLSDASEEVLLIAIESQSEALNEMEHEDLLKKLGMQEEAETWGGKDSGLEMESEMMKATTVPNAAAEIP